MDAVRTVVEDTVGLLLAHRFDEVRDLFAPQLRAVVSAGALAAAWHDVADGPIHPGAPTIDTGTPGVVVARVPLHGERNATLIVESTPDGALVGLRLMHDDDIDRQTTWRSPDYADPRRFDE